MKSTFWATLAVALAIPGMALAAGLTCTDSSAGVGTGSNGNAPAGCIWDLYNTIGATTLPNYTFFTTSFTATVTGTEYVSFAFRESPSYFAFDNACVSTSAVTATSCTGNELVNPDFELPPANVYGDNCGDGGSGTPCPTNWGAWIQPIDTNAIGQIATNSQTYGCNVGAQSGTVFWCDGSVQGYDAIYQQVATVLGQTYNIGFWLQDRNSTMTPANTDTSTSNTGQIDALVYAGTAIPVGTIPIGTAPEPTTYALVGIGLVAMGAIRARRSRKA